MPAENCRLFLAIWPDASVRAQLALHMAAWAWPPDCTRYNPADWHLTLHFLGAVPKAAMASMAERLRVPFEPFQAELRTPQLWPRGLAVLRASVVPPALQTLHARLGQALQGMNFTLDDRPYSPHVTLARHADTATPPASTTPIAWPVRDYALVQSTGQPSERYRILRRYPAAGGDAA